MSEGYKQASEITRNLIIAFVGGIVVGCAIGWGARSTISGPPTAQPELSVAAQTPSDATPVAPVPPPEAPAPPAEPVVNTTPPTSMASFEPDVDGLWPAGHLWVGIQGTRADVETQEWLNEFKPGGVVLGPENVLDPLQLGALVLQIKQAVGLGTTINDPPFIVYDDRDNALPHILADPAAGSEPITADIAAAQAVEALKQGVGVFLGPALDIYIPGVSEPQVQRASLGETADLVSAAGLGYAQLLLNAGLVPVAKHFPGAGLVSKDADGTWRIPAGQMDELAMAMQPFKTAIDAEIPGILVGLMAVPGIDTERPNRPGALSPRLLQLLVRDDWDYGGVLIADDITRHPMTRDLPREEIALKALFSGCDVVILRDAARADLRKICETFVSLSSRSEFPATQMEESKQRLIAWRGRLGKPLSRQVAPVVAEAPTPDPAMPSEAPAESPTSPEAEVAPAQEPTPIEAAATPAPPESPAEPAMTEVTPAPDTPEAEPVVPESSETAAVVAVEPELLEHTIVKGDSLTALAKKYNVSVSDIRRWNNMDSDVIKIGQVLKLHVAADSSASPAPETPAPEAPAPEAPAPEAPASEAPASEAPASEAPAPEAPAPEAPAPETATPDADAPSMDPVSPAPEADLAAATVEAPPKTPEPASVPETDAPAPAEEPETSPAVETAPTAVVTAPAASSQPPGTDRREHIVTAGETLGLVAATYGVSVADIQSWNGLDPEETVITAGAALVVYLPTAESTPGATPPATPAEAPVSEPSVGGTTSAKPDEEKSVYVAPAPGTYDEHVVVTGDNLRRIAQRYGTTQQVIIEMNNITDPNLVKLGAKLKVPKQPEGAAPSPPSGATP